MPNGLGVPIDHRAEGTNVQRKLIWSLKAAVAAAKKKNKQESKQCGIKAEIVRQMCSEK